MDIAGLLKKSNLSLYNDSKMLLIKSKLNFSNEPTIGVLIIGVMAFCAILISIFDSEDVFVAIFILIIGLVMLTFTLFTLSKQVTDFVLVTHNKIKFSNSLKRKEFAISSHMGVRMKSKIDYTRTHQYLSGSSFCIIELFLAVDGKELRILDFIMDKRDEAEANFLGEKIKAILEERLNQI